MSGQGVRILPHAPGDLTRGKLRRLGEGIGKVVYASEHWVVKRERAPSEIVALIVVWKALRKMEKLLPGTLGKRLVDRPARQIRLLRVFVQAMMPIVPRGLWLTTHTKEVWKLYRSRDNRGERLAEEHLAGTDVLPERVEFPPTEVRIGGWPGWLTVSEATQRVEGTLHQRLSDLARAQEWDELELWLNRFLELRRAGWQRGVFSLDAHLKNFGVTEDRVVLLDPGGLTNEWSEVEDRLKFEREIKKPHAQLGLGPLLRPHPEIAERFDNTWRSSVNFDEVRRHWPAHSENGDGVSEPTER
jgi:hypothetical protein